MTERPLPAITPETRHFWEGTRAGELRLQKCAACSHVYFPPRPFCPQCASARGRRAARQRPGHAVQLCHPSSPGARLRAAVLDRGGAARGRPADDDQHRGGRADTGARCSSTCRSRSCFSAMNDEISLPLFRPAGSASMKPGSIAIVGAAETTELGVIPHMSQIQLHADCALNALRDAGAEALRHRRRCVRRRGPDQRRALPRHRAEVGRWHRGGRLLVHAACAACGGGNQRRAVQDGADHARRERPLAHRCVAPEHPARDACRGSSKRPSASWARRRCSPSRCCAT